MVELGSRFRAVVKQILSDGWGRLERYDFEMKTQHRGWQHQIREIWDHGDGVACLLHDENSDTVLLVRQFRLVAALTGEDGYLIEVPAGMVDEKDHQAQMLRELAEETGYQPTTLRKVATAFASPGSCTEKITLFEGTYSRAHQTAGKGGGNAEEGEEIEILHVKVDDAFQMIEDGQIIDAKTILLLQRLALRRKGHSNRA